MSDWFDCFEILQCLLVVFIVVRQAEKKVKGLDPSVFQKMQLWRKNGFNKLKEKLSEMEQWFVKSILGRVSERIELRAIQNISFYLQLYPRPVRKLGTWFWLDDCCTYRKYWHCWLLITENVSPNQFFYSKSLKAFYCYYSINVWTIAF